MRIRAVCREVGGTLRVNEFWSVCKLKLLTFTLRSLNAGRLIPGVIILAGIMALHMRSACPMQRMVRPIQTRPCTPASRVVRCSATDGNKRVIKGKCFVTKDVRAACASGT